VGQLYIKPIGWLPHDSKMMSFEYLCGIFTVLQILHYATALNQLNILIR